MADTDVVSVRVFSLNCWSVIVVFSFFKCILMNRHMYESTCKYTLSVLFLLLFVSQGGSATSAKMCLSVMPWLEICCTRKSMILFYCKRLVETSYNVPNWIELNNIFHVKMADIILVTMFFRFGVKKTISPWNRNLTAILTLITSKGIAVPLIPRFLCTFSTFYLHNVWLKFTSKLSYLQKALKLP